MKAGLTPLIRKKEIAEGIEHLIDRKMYYPNYAPMVSKAH